jgi:hypothetical protein
MMLECSPFASTSMQELLYLRNARRMIAPDRVKRTLAARWPNTMCKIGKLLRGGDADEGSLG